MPPVPSAARPGTREDWPAKSAVPLGPLPGRTASERPRPVRPRRPAPARRASERASEPPRHGPAPALAPCTDATAEPAGRNLPGAGAGAGPRQCLPSARGLCALPSFGSVLRAGSCGRPPPGPRPARRSRKPAGRGFPGAAAEEVGRRRGRGAPCPRPGPRTAPGGRRADRGGGRGRGPGEKPAREPGASPADPPGPRVGARGCALLRPRESESRSLADPATSRRAARTGSCAGHYRGW